MGEDRLEGRGAAGVARALADVGDGKEERSGDRRGRRCRDALPGRSVFREGEREERSGDPTRGDRGDGENEQGGFLHQALLRAARRFYPAISRWGRQREVVL